LLAEDLQMRAIAGSRASVRADVVDLVLPFFHAAHIVGQRYGLGRALAMGRCESQQLGDAFFVAGVLAGTFLQDLAELLPELRILLGLVLGKVFEQRKNALGGPLA